MSEVSHIVVDEDTRFILNPITRKLYTESKKKSLVQGDHQSERFTFELPRYIEGHDMSLCNAVQVHYINVQTKTKNTSTGVYEADDLTLQGDKVTFSWLIRNQATRYAGTLAFLIKLQCIGENSAIDYEYNSEDYTKISISPGRNNGEAEIEESTDILAAWKAEVLADVNRRLENAGAVDADDFVKKYKGEGRVIYGNTESGIEFVSSSAVAGGIPRRTTQGNLPGNAPANDFDYTPWGDVKKYVSQKGRFVAANSTHTFNVETKGMIVIKGYSSSISGMTGSSELHILLFFNPVNNTTARQVFHMYQTSLANGLIKSEIIPYTSSTYTVTTTSSGGTWVMYQ